MRVFVCSPLRGPDGQPSEQNIKLARKLMRAVFDFGHSPFTPHLLYPQVLSESPKDLEGAFRANYAFLDVCEEIWVWGRVYEDCSKGMKLEIDRAAKTAARNWENGTPHIRYMPLPFEEVEREMLNDTTTVRVGACKVCSTVNGLNRADMCLKCFAAGTPT